MSHVLHALRARWKRLGQRLEALPAIERERAATCHWELLEELRPIETRTGQVGGPGR